jgi:cytochrome P450
LRRRVIALIEALPENEPFDFVARFSRDLPLQAICLLIGVPQEDRAELAAWVDAGIAAPSPEVIAREYALRLRGYGARLIAEKRQRPADDILSTIIAAQLDPEEDGAAGGPLTDSELLNFFMLLFTAGAETTRSAIGGGLYALMQTPEQLEQLRAADIAAVRTALDEILRWTTPSISTSAARQRATSPSRAIASGRATRSPTGRCRPTATKPCSTIPFASTSPAPPIAT